MSDPVTNVEIEDVLSSIRRLVADGEKSRRPFAPAENAERKSTLQAERFVLTPSLRVTEKPDAPPPVEVESDSNDEQVGLESGVTSPDATPAPLVLEPDTMLSAPKIHDKMTESERASLEATIAELEAAVTFKPDDEWEPDGSEVRPTSGLAAAFAAMNADIEDAEKVVQERVVHLRPEKDEPTFRHAPAYDAEVDESEMDYGDDLRENDDEGMPIPDDLDETLAAYIAGGTAMDRAEIRQLVVEVVRQELQGELGERISRNIRKLVRREIQRVTTSNIYD